MIDFDILAAHAAAQPGKAALVDGSRRVSFAQLNESAQRTTAGLAGLGVRAGDRVAVMSFNCIESVVVGHALRRLGAIGVPVNYRLLGREVAHVIRDSGASLICADPDHAPVVEDANSQLGESPARVLLTWGMERAGWHSLSQLTTQAKDSDAGPPAGLSLGASLIYTSGTTGSPKAAYRPQGLPIDALLQAIQLFELRSDDIFLMAGPGYHSANLLFGLLHQGLGATLVLMRKFDAAKALRTIERERVTTTCLAPTMLRMICELPDTIRETDLSSLRAVILAAAACPYELKRRATDLLGPVLWEFYGATETGVNILLRPEDQLRKPGSCGRPAPGTEIRLLDDAGRDVPVGMPGELWARSPWTAEYYRRPEANAAVQRDGFFTVGDVAYRDEEGYYYICDRKVDMINSGGVNVYPAEVEAVLLQHPAVADAAVIGVADEKWGEAVHAVAVRRPGSELDGDELIDFCRQRLADFKKPRTVEFVEELPRDPAGKLLKRELRERYRARARPGV